MGMTDKREDADLPEWDTPGTPVNPAYMWQCDELRGEIAALHVVIAEDHATIERLRAELLTCQETLTACLETA